MKVTYIPAIYYINGYEREKCVIVLLSNAKEERTMKNLMDKTVKKVTEKNIEKSANSYCQWFFHQPKAPANLKKFSKVK